MFRLVWHLADFVRHYIRRCQGATGDMVPLHSTRAVHVLRQLIWCGLLSIQAQAVAAFTCAVTTVRMYLQPSSLCWFSFFGNLGPRTAYENGCLALLHFHKSFRFCCLVLS